VRNKAASFLACELDCNSGRLSVDGIQQKLEPMVHQFLLLLIQHQGELVSKKVVVETLWPHKEPTDDALRAMVKKAREALKDNARNPTYIKTVPTKGYLLIPAVELVSTVLKSWVQLRSTLVLSIGAVVAAFIFLVIWYFVIYSSAGTTSMVTIKKSTISLMQNKNVSTYYINSALKNIWVEVSDTSDTSQVNVEDIARRTQQKIVFSVALKRQFWYSQGSQRVLVTRNDDQGFYSVQFNQQGKQPTVSEYRATLPQDIKVLALDFTGSKLFVVSTAQKAIGLFSLEFGMLTDAAELPPALINISQQIKKLFEELPLSNAGATKNFYIQVWPSPISNGFVVNIGSEAQSRLFYYKTAQEDQPTSEVNISNGLQSAVWNTQGTRFSFTDDNANLIAFQSEEGRLTTFNANGEVINQVVADCGSSCFIIANTQGIPKLSEINVTFDASQNANSVNTNSFTTNQFAQIISTNTIARNEYLPQYTDRGLYFVSQRGDNVNIMFRDSKEAESIVHTFDNQATVDEFVVDTNENKIVGIVNQRPFVFNLNTRQMRYIPLSFPRVSHIGFGNVVNNNSGDNFNDTNIITFYAETSTAGQAINARQPNGLYEYGLDTQQLSLIKENAMAQESIELMDSTDKGRIRYKALFTLQNSGVGMVNFQNNKPAITVNLSLNDCMRCWQIKGNYLYQLMPSTNIAVQSQMMETSLITGEHKKYPLLFNDLQSEFSLHPSLNKMVVSTRQRLQTELTQIEGLSQIY
jgi:DNA-binding winged helix-turn-helix (wHTH) protein